MFSALRPASSGINSNQRLAAKQFNIPEHEFLTRPWFDNWFHVRALEYLFKKNKNVKEAFDILDGLESAQAKGIIYGFDRKDLLDLDEAQIDGLLKGLQKEEVLGLSLYQINAYPALKDKGVTTKDLRENNWLHKLTQLKALGYLIGIKKYRIEEAFRFLKEKKEFELPIIWNDVRINHIDDLNHEAITALIEARKYQSFSKEEDVLGLNEHQISLIKSCFAYGVSCQTVRAFPWIKSELQTHALQRLMQDHYFPFEEAAPLIETLNESELYGIKRGLSLADVKKFKNIYQMKAYLANQGKRGLKPENFSDKNWFCGDVVVSAFNLLIEGSMLEAEEAFQELDGLTEEQVKKISNGKRRYEIIGLNKFMMKALEYNQQTGLDHLVLRNKLWFNSELHIDALSRLIVTKREKKYPHGKFSEDMLDSLEHLSPDKLQLVAGGVEVENVKHLNTLQVKLIAYLKSNTDILGIAEKDIVEANWLTTEEQYQVILHFAKNTDAFILLSGRSILDTVKDASEKGELTVIIGNKAKREIVKAMASTSISLQSMSNWMDWRTHLNLSQQQKSDQDNKLETNTPRLTRSSQGN